MDCEVPFAISLKNAAKKACARRYEKVCVSVSRDVFDGKRPLFFHGRWIYKQAESPAAIGKRERRFVQAAGPDQGQKAAPIPIAKKEETDVGRSSCSRGGDGALRTLRLGRLTPIGSR